MIASALAGAVAAACLPASFDPGVEVFNTPESEVSIALAAAGELLWVACFGSSKLVAIDPSTHEVRDRIELPAGPLNVEAHPSLPVLYASLPRRNEVVEVSVTGGGVTRSFETGIEPDGLALLSRAVPQ